MTKTQLQQLANGTLVNLFALTFRKVSNGLEEVGGDNIFISWEEMKNENTLNHLTLVG